MALSTSRVSAYAAPGMAAAATGRPASGGRNVASASAGPIEETSFSPQVALSESGLWRYDDETQFQFEGDDRRPPQQGAPFVSRSASGFKVDMVEETADPGGGGGFFLNDLVHGIGIYEFNIRITTPGAVRPGSVFNYRS